VTTLPYSGFPTDVQAQMMSLLALAPGISIITERIFESRFMHVSELARSARTSRSRAQRDCQGRQTVERRAGDGQRFARVVGAGDCRFGGERRDAGQSHLPSGPRLRRHGCEAAKLGARIQRVEEKPERRKAHIFDLRYPIYAAGGVAEGPFQGLFSEGELHELLIFGKFSRWGSQSSPLRNI